MLIVLGALDGLTDVAMNAQAIALQQRFHRSIITRFHAMWSAGAVTGGVVASRAAAAGVSLRSQLLATAAVVLAATAVAAFWLLPGRTRPDDVPDRTSARTANDGRRARSSCASSCVGVAIALVELPPNDWAALMMDDRFDISDGSGRGSGSSPRPAGCSSAGCSATVSPTGSASNPRDGAARSSPPPAS